MAENGGPVVQHQAPINAWLLMGDAASFPTAQELRRMRRRMRKDDIWTAPKQLHAGDLLLFYFMAPLKAVHFVARASSFPVFDASIGVNALREVDPNQWWVRHTALVPTVPLPFSVLQAAMGGHLNLRGKPTHYLPPLVVKGLLSRGELAPAGHPEEFISVALPPVGLPDVPDPAGMGLQDWSRMGNGHLRLEAQVEEHVVEPLLRMALSSVRGVRVERALRMPAGVPDYTVLRNDKPVSVVEVKLGVRTPSTGDWSLSPDFRQVTRYAKALQVPAALMDCNRIFLIDRDRREPIDVLERKSFSRSDLTAVRRHLLGT